jgi:DNA-binding transcriptional regulator YbjK
VPTRANAFIPTVVVQGPERRKSLVEATVRVLMRDGVPGVTHRAVADEANLPLSATTYYFTSLDNLISETCRAIYAGFISDPLFAVESPGQDVVSDIVDVFFRYITERREAYQVLYELQILAGRQQNLKSLASILWAQSSEGIQGALEISDETARTIVAILDGYAIANLSTGYVPDRASLIHVIGKIAGR